MLIKPKLQNYKDEHTPVKIRKRIYDENQAKRVQLSEDAVQKQRRKRRAVSSAVSGLSLDREVSAADIALEEGEEESEEDEEEEVMRRKPVRAHVASIQIMLLINKTWQQKGVYLQVTPNLFCYVHFNLFIETIKKCCLQFIYVIKVCFDVHNNNTLRIVIETHIRYFYVGS